MKKTKKIAAIPTYPVTLSEMERPPRNDAERVVQGIHKTTSIVEVAEKLSSGNWIAFDVETSGDSSIVYILGWV